MKNLSKWPRKAVLVYALGWPDKWLLFRVFTLLTVYKGLVLVLPFRYFMPLSTGVSGPKAIPSDRSVAEIVRTIQVVSANVPLGFTCLVQALGAKWLLHNYAGIHLHIGVQKSADAGFSAHAWVTYNNKIILGEQADQVFEPILEWN